MTNIDSEVNNIVSKNLEEIMLTKDKFLVIKELYSSGTSKRAISRMLAIDIKTVRKHLKQGCWCGYKRRTLKQGLLFAYTGWLNKRMVEVNYNATILFRELKLLGYQGSYETVKTYTAPSRKEQQRCGAATVRFETKPGQQSQADWGSSWVWLGEKRSKIHFFALVLGYSRRLFAKAYINEKLPSLLDAHESAFSWFGGYTTDILYDNPKTMVNKHDIYTGEVLLNPTFKDFVMHYGYKARFCQPYRARTKGKIESGVKYVKRNFLPGRRFNNLEHLNEELSKWLLETADTRIHGTTHQRPIDRYNEEKATLQSITSIVPYRLETGIQRKVSADAMVSLDSNRYSVPWKYLGKLVDIYQQEGILQIFYHGRCIAQHPKLVGKHQRSIEQKHFAGIFRTAIKLIKTPPRHDPYWWDDIKVSVRNLDVYEQAAGGQ